MSLPQAVGTQKLLEGLGCAGHGCVSLPQSSSLLFPRAGQVFILCWGCMVLWRVHPSSLVLRVRFRFVVAAWGFSWGDQSPAGSLSAQGFWDVPSAPAGTAPASSRTALSSCVCALGLMDHTGEGMGLCVIMFYLITAPHLLVFKVFSPTFTK